MPGPQRVGHSQVGGSSYRPCNNYENIKGYSISISSTHFVPLWHYNCNAVSVHYDTESIRAPSVLVSLQASRVRVHAHTASSVGGYSNVNKFALRSLLSYDYIAEKMPSLAYIYVQAFRQLTPSWPARRQMSIFKQNLFAHINRDLSFWPVFVASCLFLLLVDLPIRTEHYRSRAVTMRKPLEPRRRQVDPQVTLTIAMCCLRCLWVPVFSLFIPPPPLSLSLSAHEVSRPLNRDLWWSPGSIQS